MVEGARRKKAIVMAMALSLLSVGCSSDERQMFETPNSMSFQECYAGCFILCAIIPTRTLSSCGLECLMDCLIPQNNDDENKNMKILQFCRLGCASVECTSMSTLKNPGAKEVAGCVGSCSGLCTENYMTAP